MVFVELYGLPEGLPGRVSLGLAFCGVFYFWVLGFEDIEFAASSSSSSGFRL